MCCPPISSTVFHSTTTELNGPGRLNRGSASWRVSFYVTLGLTLLTDLSKVFNLLKFKPRICCLLSVNETKRRYNCYLEATCKTVYLVFNLSGTSLEIFKPLICILYKKKHNACDFKMIPQEKKNQQAIIFLQ